MTLAGLSPRARRAAMQVEATYQRVLLSVYVLADETGLECRATNAEIARACGHSAQAVGRSVAEMERRGLAAVFRQRNGLNFRTIILLDHERGPKLAAHYDRTVRIKRSWEA